MEMAKAEMLKMEKIAKQQIEEMNMSGRGMMTLQNQIDMKDRSRQEMEEEHWQMQKKMRHANQQMEEQMKQSERKTKNWLIDFI